MNLTQGLNADAKQILRQIEPPTAKHFNDIVTKVCGFNDFNTS
jgi:hypothetical protein